jgi:glycosyltransferase involved in cell wall biosynthesis
MRAIDHAPRRTRIAAEPGVDFTAIFASSAGIRPHDAGYGEHVTFDVDLTKGYRSVFLKKANTNPTSGGFFSLFDRDVVGALIRGRYDVLWLHGYNFASHALAALTQRATGGKLLVREEQTLLHPRSVPRTLLKELALRAFLFNVSALYIGTHSKLWFEHYGVPAARLFFTPYCVDNDRLQATAATLRTRKRELQQALGVHPDRTPVILTVSRLVESKRTALLLEAFKRVRSQRACTLLVVGAGECEETLKRTVDREAIPDVVFTGFLDQAKVPLAYAAADVFTLFSGVNETWGLAVNEAMNFGLPVVVSDKVGCSADIVQNGRNGFVVRSGDVATLAIRLATLVDNEDLRNSLGAESLTLIEPWNYDQTACGVLDATAAVVVGP